MSERAGFVTDPLFLGHASPGHPERPERIRAILDHLDRTGLRARMTAIDPRDATDDELLAVHDRALLEQEARAAQQHGWLDPDTYVKPESPAVARRAAGAVLAALEAVLGSRVRSAFAAVRPPGHHATRERAMGFCLVNHVAVAAAAALRAGVERVAVVDWDVHHGNGTQAIFDAEPRVFYASTHAYPFYPGTGHYSETGTGDARGTKVNVPLPGGTGDDGFIAAYEQVVIPALERFAPGLVLVSCGWDAHARDPLATLDVSTAGYTRVARMVVEAARRLCDGRLLAVLEGGYDPHALAWCSAALCALLLDEPPPGDPEPVAVRHGPNIESMIVQIRMLHGLP